MGTCVHGARKVGVRLFEPASRSHYHKEDLMGIHINGKVKGESPSELLFPVQKLSGKI
jgi:hypothetical protein